MESDGSHSLYLILFLIFIIFNSILVLGETAILNLNDKKLKKLSSKENKKAKLILKKLENADYFYDLLSNCIVILTIISSIIASIYFINLLTPIFLAYSVEAVKTFVPVLSTFFSILISSIIITVFVYKIPKKLGTHYCEFFATFSINIILLSRFVLFPINFISSLISSLFLKLFKNKEKKDSNESTEEEILFMVNSGNENGFIEESQKDMINKIFEFDDICASDVMTHRTEIEALKKDSSIADITFIAINKGFSRIPVYQQDLDDIIGVIYVKDLLSLVGCTSSKNIDINNFIRPLIYVPESTKCKDLFKQLKLKKTHMAIVVDNYGGTSGIVTMEDLIESVFGNIQDEYDQEEEEIKVIDENTFIISGSASLDSISKYLEIEIPQDDEYDTIAGYITDILGRIPEINETPSVVASNIEFTVMVVEERRISKLKAVRIKKSAH